MRILTFTAYYTPEIASSMYLTEDILEGMAKAGHSVDLYVPMPCRGVDNKTRDDYKKKKIEIKHSGLLTIHRFALFKEGKNPLLRAVRYALMNIIFVCKGLFTRADIIFIQSTPPTQGLMAGVLKSLKHIPVVYNLQDVFPDSLVSGGLTKEGSAIWKIGRIIEKYSYKKADEIIVISEDIKNNLIKKGVPESKINVVSNWIDIETVRPIPKAENRLFEELGLSREGFIVLYAGNFGAAQGADIVIKTAELLSSIDDIQFVIFGGGSEFSQAQEYSRKKTISNVKMFNLMPPSRISEVYSMADVSLITCKPGFGKSGMPSKTWSIMACNKTIVASFDTDSELARIIKMANAGICVEPGKPDILAMAVKTIYELKDNRKNEGRKFVENHMSKRICVDKYIEIIEMAGEVL